MKQNCPSDGRTLVNIREQRGNKKSHSIGMGKFMSGLAVGTEMPAKTIEDICKRSFYYVYSKYIKYQYR
ncbi:MAG TPA: hypothetical protein DCS30_04140 [Rhizobiales bacterium]|nr:hypothetical protein [Hyphomicrobiales bacterium]